MVKPNNFYNGNPLLKKARLQIAWTPELVNEFARCKEDPIYFAEKYIKIVHVDKGLIPIVLYDYQKEIIGKISGENRLCSVVTSRQAGKALSLDTEIPLADGSWTTMGDIQPGDVILGARGQPTVVTFKSEIHNKPTYKITFEGEGQTAIACEDHLWTVFDRSDRKLKTINTKTMVKSFQKQNKVGHTQYRYAILNTEPVQYPEQVLAIDPYVLGAWLGDGGTHSAKFTCHTDHMSHFIEQGLVFNSQVSYERNQNSNVFTNTITGLQALLKQEGVFGFKHIPAQYLIGSVAQRTRLLQGLMDTDGFVEKNGTCQIQLSSKTETLVEGIQQLLNSLGFKWTKSYFEKTDSVRLSWSTSTEHVIPVTIPHKLARIKQTLLRDRYVFSRSITDIKLIDSHPTQCITVDAPDHLFLFGRSYIPTHNTTTAAVIILHFIIFNSHKTVGLLANKGDAAREILDRIKIAYEALPEWLQQGVAEWNKGNIVLENGCKVIAAATSSSSIRGKTVAFLYIDEAAFVENWDEFFSAVYPTISSGKETRMLFTSTPNGLNHFYKTCEGARQGTNGYQFVEVPWFRVPGRDEAWRQMTLAGMDFNMEKFDQEFNCAFLGSSGTLISGQALKNLVPQVAIRQAGGLMQYKMPEAGHQYTICVDVSRGKGLDYSAFQIIDISQMPYNQVCTYKNNMITPGDYAGVIHSIAKTYNDATILVEINDVGQQVADTLFSDYECESLIYTENAGGRGKRISGGFGKSVDRGIRTTKTTKAIGCSMLKMLIEQHQLIINDHSTIFELSRFSRKGVSYEAESGCNDDLVMGLVLFAWMTDQPYFKDLTDINTLLRLRERSEEDIENDVLPFGFIDDGRDEHPQVVDASTGYAAEFEGQFF